MTRAVPRSRELDSAGGAAALSIAARDVTGYLGAYLLRADRGDEVEFATSVLATASRGLMEGGASAGDIAIALATAAALTAVFAPLTTRLYRSKS
jgi:hypothetical protein